MRTSVLGDMYQFEETVYPNRNQGYGVYQLESLPKLLEIPLD